MIWYILLVVAVLAVIGLAAAYGVVFPRVARDAKKAAASGGSLGRVAHVFEGESEPDLSGMAFGTRILLNGAQPPAASGIYEKTKDGGMRRASCLERDDQVVVGSTVFCDANSQVYTLHAAPADEEWEGISFAMSFVSLRDAVLGYKGVESGYLCRTEDGALEYRHSVQTVAARGGETLLLAVGPSAGMETRVVTVVTDNNPVHAVDPMNGGHAVPPFFWQATLAVIGDSVRVAQIAPDQTAKRNDENEPVISISLPQDSFSKVGDFTLTIDAPADRTFTVQY